MAAASVESRISSEVGRVTKGPNYFAAGAMSSYLVNHVQVRLLAHAHVSLSGKTFSHGNIEKPHSWFPVPGLSQSFGCVQEVRYTRVISEALRLTGCMQLLLQ